MDARDSLHTVTGLVMRTADKAKRDDISGEAAKAAYYFALSLFPLILTLFAATGLLGGDRAFAWIMGNIRGAAPAETSQYLEQFVREVTSQPQPGLFSLGVLLTLWSASNVFIALGDGLDVVFAARNTRPWWKRRLIALGLLLTTYVVLMGGATIVLAGPEIAAALRLGAAGRALQLALTFVLQVALLTAIYYVLPCHARRRSVGPVAAGAVAGAVLWLLATSLFRLYVANFGSYSRTYGFVGGIIVLLLWLYLTALTILAGGEVAAVLEARDTTAETPGAPRGLAEPLQSA